MTSILLVGSKFNKLMYLALLLEEVGYDTYRCHDWSIIDQLVAEKQPNLIIIDDRNSEEYVTSLACHLHANPDYAVIPVILLTKTADSNATLKQRVIKPILPHELFVTIDKMLPLQEERGQG